MTKKVFLVLLSIYIIMLGLNFLTPLYYGDDYVYAFIWNNQFMNIPLPEHVTRINSVSDIFLSQWRHYFTGNGRLIAHLFVQFFVWQGKWLFNFLNPLVFLLLILQIHWISDEGKISFKNLRTGMLCWIFFALWTFVIGFWSVYLWLAGACNYLWSVVILLSFILVYIRKYFRPENSFRNLQRQRMRFWIFLLGVFSGWSNENTICWIILIMGVWFYKMEKEKQLENWMVCGYVGLCLGYTLLVFAPGNAVKTNYYLENYFMNSWLNIFAWEYLKTRLINFGIIEYWQIFLWFYIITSLKRMKLTFKKDTFSKYTILVKFFCFISILSNIIMLLTPDFPFRSGFPSLVFVVIATVLLIRVQQLSGNKYLSSYGKKILTVIGCFVFFVSLISTYWGHYLTYQYDLKMVKKIAVYKATSMHEVLIIPAFSGHSSILDWISGQHLKRPDLTDNEHDWKNVAVARYYEIKEIRTGSR